ncbi:MAG TPA: hypothetical protein PLO89_06115 [Spirochaetota bacterium]|nr:hypothetical protein [Spirochaetota bacterium]
MSKISFILLFFITAFCIHSQNSKYEPSWIYLKKAENFKEKRDYASALTMARLAKQVRIEEKLESYKKELYDKHKDKTEYEIKKIVAGKKDALIESDNYPEYHELVGDLYYLTGFLEEAIKEYKITVEQKNFFEYSEKIIEVKYKLGNVYEKIFDYELADIVYREIVDIFIKKRKDDFWDRIKINIKDDPTLEKVMRIYRIEGMEYMKAFYKVGKRASIIGRSKEALFYLSVACVLWMTHRGSEIKKERFDFQYSNLLDFLNLVTKKEFKDYVTDKNYLIDETLFFIGYSCSQENEDISAIRYYDLAKKFSVGSKREESINNRIEYLKNSPEHRLSYDEVID